MIDRWDNEKGLNICVYNSGILCIGYKWLFYKLEKFGFDTFIYSCDNDTSINFRGSYPKEKTIEIKKFFFDNYPAIETIIPLNDGMIVKFKVKIKLNQPTLL